jgi:hypothetical protein
MDGGVEEVVVVQGDFLLQAGDQDRKPGFSGQGRTGMLVARYPLLFCGAVSMAVKHVVLWSFKAGLPPEKVKESNDLIRALKDKIPLVKEYVGGSNISEEGLSQGFTFGFVMTFSDKKAVSEYLKHSEHTRTVEKVLPFLEKIVVVDFEV